MLLVAVALAVAGGGYAFWYITTPIVIARLPIEFEVELYLASERDLRERIQEVSGDVASLLLIGHNPGIAELALQLAARGHPEALADMRHKFPTAALAELGVRAQRWRHFARGCELASFVTPKQLSP